MRKTWLFWSLVLSGVAHAASLDVDLGVTFTGEGGFPRTGFGAGLGVVPAAHWSADSQPGVEWCHWVAVQRLVFLGAHSNDVFGARADFLNWQTGTRIALGTSLVRPFGGVFLSGLHRHTMTADKSDQNYVFLGEELGLEFVIENPHADRNPVTRISLSVRVQQSLGRAPSPLLANLPFWLFDGFVTFEVPIAHW